MKGKRGPAATIFTLVLLAFFVVPPVILSIKTAHEFKDIAVAYRSGEVHIPPPPPKVNDWPVIGNTTYQVWSQASHGVDTLVQHYRPQVKRVAGKTISLIASTAKGLLIFTLSIIICGAFLYNSEDAGAFAKRLFNRLVETPRFDVANVAAKTIRNVVKGILMVAIIQTTLAGIGFLAAHIPAAGIWTILCLILGIIQVGTFPVAIITIVYIWGVASPLTATLFTIWMIFVSVIDNILKPLLLGKGAPVPMLVVFLGAIGGFILSGFMGLFTGAVVLSLGYILFSMWLKEPETEAAAESKDVD